MFSRVCDKADRSENNDQKVGEVVAWEGPRRAIDPRTVYGTKHTLVGGVSQEIGQLLLGVRGQDIVKGSSSPS